MNQSPDARARKTTARTARGPVISLTLESSCEVTGTQPVAIGIPLPRGTLRNPDAVLLRDARRRRTPVQTTVLSHWPDGSVRWLLVEALAGPLQQGRHVWSLELLKTTKPLPSPSRLELRHTADALWVDTGAATFSISRHTLGPVTGIDRGGQPLLAPSQGGLTLTDETGRICEARVQHIELEAQGPIRTTVRIDAVLEGDSGCRLVTRLCFFAGTGLVRARLTLHNPRRAQHKGGLWDLGDPGSMLFHDLTWTLGLPSAPSHIFWRAEPEAPRVTTVTRLEIYQDSSGGENWQSRNHLNRNGIIPCAFRGYRVRTPGRDRSGLRAAPVVGIQTGQVCLEAAMVGFWQEFPKALEVDDAGLHLRFFPHQFGDLFELQGGEQKTHTCWLNVDAPPTGTGLSLDWVHRPIHIQIDPSWIEASGTLQHFIPTSRVPRATPRRPTSSPASAHSSSGQTQTPLEPLLSEVVQGPHPYVTRREIIDEYGWRNFGEIYADHEEAYYKGPRPVISHYNNQYDFLYGLVLNGLRSGDARWLELAGPLARHVIDIDIYHTQADKAAYNGGLFWHTDHYVDAATSTHRTYSAKNAAGRRGYGGGPASQHNFTTGLLYFHYLTGDPDARDAVIGLADWAERMDDGRWNLLALVDDSPTGWATSTFNFQGPGRGAGWSINALLDGWLLTGRRHYVECAEALIRRTVHPADDVAAYDLLNAELRWSYTLYLTTLARYLHIKADAGEIDVAYQYAQGALVRYASWMLENEVPYFDRIETLEFPTETWAGQELRKANVLRQAAGHVDDPLRSRLIQRGAELADRAWSDLMKFESRTVARSMAIVMTEGPRDAFFRAKGAQPAPRAARSTVIPPLEPFTGQRERIRAQLKHPLGLVRALWRMTELERWKRLLEQPNSLKP